MKLIALLFFNLLVVFINCSGQETYKLDNKTVDWKRVVESTKLKAYYKVCQIPQVILDCFPNWKRQMADSGGTFNPSDAHFIIVDSGGTFNDSVAHFSTQEKTMQLQFAANKKKYWIISFKTGGIALFHDCYFIMINKDNKLYIQSTNYLFETIESLKDYFIKNKL